MNIKRCISLVLLFSLMAISLISCAGADEKRTDTETVLSDESAETEDPNSIAGRKAVSDDLPEIDFGGKQFRTIVQVSTVYDIWIEEETGDVLNDEIFLRNRNIEDRFNAVIAETRAIDFSKIIPAVRDVVNAGEDAYDLVLGQMEDSGAAVVSGIFMNWYDIPNMNYSKPWYPKSIIKNAATVNGKMYSMISDLCISYAHQTWSIVYDKIVAENYGINDIYSFVNNNSWTLDRLNTLTKDVYEDLNGDGTRDENDYYGLSIGLNGCMLLAFYYGFDQRLVTVNDDYEIDMAINSEKAVNISSSLHKLFFDSPGTYNSPDSSNGGMYKKFQNGTALFCTILVGDTYAVLRDYENDYGIIPFPLWNESQTEYYSVCDAGCNILAVPATASNTEFIGIMTEALSAYSYKNVMPIYYDIALGTKSARDEESVKMLDMIFNNRIIDFAYLYDGWNGWVFSLADFVKSDSFASTYAKLESKKNSHYQKVLDFFLEDE